MKNLVFKTSSLAAVKHGFSLIHIMYWIVIFNIGGVMKTGTRSCNWLALWTWNISLFADFWWSATSFFAAYALPTFAQLTVTSYYAASSASHYAISQITRQIEKAHLSGTGEKSWWAVGNQFWVVFMWYIYGLPASPCCISLIVLPSSRHQTCSTMHIIN
jgi:hypothetical protein